MGWDALLGGLVGAAIPGAFTYLALIRARQAANAEAFGAAVLLLDHLHPDRVSFNASRNLEAEAAKWTALEKQNNDARARLLVVSAGHPRQQVRDLAAQAAVKLANAYQSSLWQAHDVVRNQPDKDWREHALKQHEEAEKAVQALIRANFRWVRFGSSS